MKHFTIKELVYSDTANRLGIDNTPDEKIVFNLNKLVDNILDPIRTLWGGPIRVTSCYRCPELNDAVGGVKTSQHKDGLAADIQPWNYNDMGKFIEFVKGWCAKHEFDQCIIEGSGKKMWIHISWRDTNRRKKMFTMHV